MSMVSRIVGGMAVVCFMAAPAAGQSFSGVSEKANTVKSPEALAALFWSQQPACDEAGGDLATRQCKGIAAARKQQLDGARLLVHGDGEALEAGDYNDKTRTIQLAVRGCAACEKPVEVGGDARYVVAGAAGTARKGGGVTAKPLVTVKVKVKNQPDASRFEQTVLPRLRTQLVIGVGGAKSFKAGAKSGYQVDLIGYRVYDPCDGQVYAAKPKSSTLPPDKRYCSGEPVAEEKPDEPDEPAEPKLPRELSTAQIRDALEPAKKAARKCFEAYGVPGMARFRITISASGEVIGLREKGDFMGTPTSACIREAIKKVSFPKSRKDRTTVDYPFILR